MFSFLNHQSFKGRQTSHNDMKFYLIKNTDFSLENIVILKPFFAKSTKIHIHLESNNTQCIIMRLLICTNNQTLLCVMEDITDIPKHYCVMEDITDIPKHNYVLWKILLIYPNITMCYGRYYWYTQTLLCVMEDNVYCNISFCHMQHWLQNKQQKAIKFHFQ